MNFTATVGIMSQVFFGLWAKHSTFLYEFTSQFTQRLGGNPVDLEERIVVSVLLCSDGLATHAAPSGSLSIVACGHA